MRVVGIVADLGANARNAHIDGTNGKSQGVVPFLKVINDTAVAVNQGGKRKARYVPTWRRGIWTSRISWSCGRIRVMIVAEHTI